MTTGTSGGYSDFKRLNPQYEQWKQNRDIQDAKRQEYLRQNGNPKGTEQDIEHGNAMLRAIDTMDEYSQSYAEDNEIATEAIAGTVTQLSTMGGMALGGLLAISKPGKALIEKMPKQVQGYGGLVIAGGTAILATIAALFPIQGWAAIQNIKASRNGRFEAMKNDLSNPAQFAVLTDEQKKQVEKDAAKISDADVKNTATKGGLNGFLAPFKRAKEMFIEDKKIKQEKEEFIKNLESDVTKFDLPLDADKIEKAKKDQQLLTKMTEKIDVASQDYTETAELVTNAVTAFAFAGGGAVGFLTKKLLDLFKVKNFNVRMLAPVLVGGALTIGVSAFATKIQKQAARVARFKVMQKVKENPSEFIYVDDEKAANINVAAPKKEEKKNIFAFLKDLYQENKEYNQYLKAGELKNKKFAKALSNVQLSETQEKDAKSLQRNTFKTFCEIDEKSQMYSEKTEVFWERVKTPVVLITEAIGMGLGALAGSKVMNKTGNPMALSVGMILGIIPALFANVAIDAVATKEQKEASRVANMEAIKALSDYRHFVDYSAKS